MPAKPKPTPKPKGKLTKEYPTDETLEKYGLSRLDFKMLLESQNGVCPVCEKVPTTGRWYIDHEHVKGWKKLPAEKRKLYVRGVLCYFCNRFYLAKAMTAVKANNIIKYLGDYAIRKNQAIR